MSGRTYFVAPSLLVGDVPTGLSRCVAVDTAEQAMAVIRVGNRAVLPFGAVEKAVNVLIIQGLSPEQVRRRLHYADTGCALGCGITAPRLKGPPTALSDHLKARKDGSHD